MSFINCGYYDHGGSKLIMKN